jgi:hypothetical protein
MTSHIYMANPAAKLAVCIACAAAAQAYLVGIRVDVTQWHAMMGGLPVQPAAQHALVLQQPIEQLPKGAAVRMRSCNRHLSSTAEPCGPTCSGCSSASALSRRLHCTCAIASAPDVSPALLLPASAAAGCTGCPRTVVSALWPSACVVWSCGLCACRCHMLRMLLRMLGVPLLLMACTHRN